VSVPDTLPSPPSPLWVEGIDVSRYQWPIDWGKIRAASTGEIEARIRPQFVIIKATDGQRGIDERFVEHWKGARGAGLVLGAYHFAQPDEDANDAALEADNHCDALEMVGGLADYDLAPSLDAEKRRAIRRGEPFCNWTIDFHDRVSERTRRRGMTYTGGPFWDEADGDPDEATIMRIAAHPLWLAAYVRDPDRYVPPAWAGKGWTFWQRSGDEATRGETPLQLPGIVGNVDRNVFRGTLTDLREFVADSHIVEIVRTLDRERPYEVTSREEVLDMVADTPVKPVA
jgi:lysozyme